MAKFFSVLSSPRLMAVLFVVYAIALGLGTFIENEYNTDTARVYIYNARWFEVIMVMFAINFIGNIKRYNLLRKEKWATLMLHLAFLLILVGAFITRYISFEGMMPIREGETENVMYSDRAFITALVDGEYQGEMRRRTFEKPVILSPVADNDYKIKSKFAETPFEIRVVDYIMGAQETITPSETGKRFLKLVEAGEGTRHEHYLSEGELQNIHNVLYAFNKPTPGAINIHIDNDIATIEMPFEGRFMRMADNFEGDVLKDSLQPLMFRSLYTIGEARFVFPEEPTRGTVSYKSDGDYKNKESIDALVVEVAAGDETRKVTLMGAKGMTGEPQVVSVGGLEFTLLFGSKTYELPFSLKLNDFIADKYPGTEKSYSAFESRVTVIDSESGNFDTRIYMNNVLDHKGYRFFQASFDPDEKGTILSVNHDFWGTWITYIGYTLLYIGMIGVFFTKHSRFGELKRKLEGVRKKKAKMAMMLLLFLGFSASAQHEGHDHGTAEIQRPAIPSAKQADSLISMHKISAAHAAKFGALVIQDQGGRMKPVNTFSSELLRKVSKSDTYKGLNADQVFLSMTQFPTLWFEVPLIHLKRGNDSIRKIIGIPSDAKSASFISFFDNKGNYKLGPYLDEAYRASVPDQFQKDFIEADRKVNLLNSALSGSILRIFPIPNHENNKWVSYLELDQANLTGLDSAFTRQIIPMYLMSIKNGTDTGDYKEADFYLGGIEKYQRKYGKDVMPAKSRIQAEITYNRFDVFKRLFSLYMIAGSLLLVLTIANIFTSVKAVKWASKGLHWLIWVFFGFHTLGLAARWYISGHAPWSDAYESMIYVAWATMLFTLLFDRKSMLTIASGTFVTSMILMIAHWNWMDPSIANLAPVLDSYWLMIHVAVIVGSYGPFTLGMILGIVTMILMIIGNQKNHQKIDLHIKELTYINEMALTIGLVMLTIGNFLGGQWANESWGRYWGWDPKETWALVSIMVYAFVIHMRFIPGLRNRWVFTVSSVFAFYAIMMTYFGVNFYLSGLHSYASGDKVVTPSFIYYSVAILTVLSALAWYRNRQLENRS